MAGALRELLAHFGVTVDRSQLTAADKAIDSAAAKLKGLATTAAIGFAINGVRHMVDDLVDAGVELKNTSDRLGITTQELQQWQAATNSSGVGAEELGLSFRKLEQSIGAAGGGAKYFTIHGTQLRVALKNVDGTARSMSAVFRDAGLAIGSIKDPSVRAKAAAEDLGRGGGKLLSFFQQGPKHVDALLGKLKEFGGGISDDAIDKLQRMKEAQGEWDITLTSAKSALVSEFLPALTVSVSWLAKSGVELLHNKEAMQTLAIGAVTVGGAIAAAGLVAIGPWLPLVGIVGGLVLIFQDLYVAANGGKSVFGPILEQITGKSTGTIFTEMIAELHTLETDWRAFWSDIKKGGAGGALSNATREALGLPRLTDTELSGGSDLDKLEDQQVKDDLRRRQFSKTRDNLPGGLGAFVPDSLVDQHNSPPEVEGAGDALARKLDEAVRGNSVISNIFGAQGLRAQGGVSALSQDAIIALAKSQVEASQPNLGPGAARTDAIASRVLQITQQNNNQVTIQGNAGADDVADGLNQANATNYQSLAASVNHPVQP